MIAAITSFDVEFTVAAVVTVVMLLVLLTGWFTRTVEVTWLAVGLGLLSGTVFGLSIYINRERLARAEPINLVVLRFIASAWGLTFLAAIWGAIRLLRERRRRFPKVVARPETAIGRDWLLSQLQDRAAASGEKLSTVTGRPSGTSGG